jgi:hypothetical protein
MAREKGMTTTTDGAATCDASDGCFSRGHPSERVCTV